MENIKCLISFLKSKIVNIVIITVVITVFGSGLGFIKHKQDSYNYIEVLDKPYYTQNIYIQFENRDRSNTYNNRSGKEDIDITVSDISPIFNNYTVWSEVFGGYTDEMILEKSFRNKDIPDYKSFNEVYPLIAKTNILNSKMFALQVTALEKNIAIEIADKYYDIINSTIENMYPSYSLKVVLNELVIEADPVPVASTVSYLIKYGVVFTAFGLFVSVGFYFLKYALSDTIKTTEALMEVLEIPQTKIYLKEKDLNFLYSYLYRNHKPHNTVVGITATESPSEVYPNLIDVFSKYNSKVVILDLNSQVQGNDIITEFSSNGSIKTINEHSDLKAAYLTSEDFSEYIFDLKKQYDFVFISIFDVTTSYIYNLIADKIDYLLIYEPHMPINSKRMKNIVGITKEEKIDTIGVIIKDEKGK